MSDFDTESTLVLDAFREVFDEVTMPTPVEQLIAAGRARRRRRRLAKATGLAAIAGLSIAIASYAQVTTAPTTAKSTTTAPSVHLGAATFVVDRQPDGKVTVTWTKQGYFQDPIGLQDALRNVGFPVLIKVGEFCEGPTDDGYLDPSGQGRDLDQVMQAGRQSNGAVVFTFIPSAMPSGTELFIGYLSPSQLAVTGGRPGSVERLVPTTAPLICSTQAPPPEPPDGHPGPAQSPQAG
jgi:hypothetical protein